MKRVVFIPFFLLIFLAGCASTYQSGPVKGDRNFFTPRNWQIPIVKEEEEKAVEPASPPAPVTTPSQTEEVQNETPENPDEQMIGYASWYGPGFHGEKTANGENYDQDELTAAHRILPMNTWVQVKNLENDKTVVIRINDRGPYKKNRIIDLTRRAAEILDFKDQGTARVSLSVVKYPKDYDQKEGLTPYKQTIVQIAVFSTEERAEAFKLQLSQKYTKLPIFIETKKNLFYILAGPYEDRVKASEVSSALKAEGIDNFVRSYKK